MSPDNVPPPAAGGQTPSQPATPLPDAPNEPLDQAIDRITQANNILVTVSANPSVDQLAAAIGMTLLLNRLDKHATAVFSGKVPSTIEFLEPEKTLEQNTDSLRDFIISLDKNKADKLRYKVEDQFVRIFITPYKTSISQKDLVFSEGDFNVELVLALGVRSRSELDAAIAAHGRILHDATTISFYAGKPPAKTPDLGQVNLVDEQASSLCEMLVSLSDSLGENLIDNQMATAFLTGIVAETKRFSNPKTTPKALSVSAKLMSAGANQQLIVSKLEPPPSPGAPPAASPRQPKSPPPAPPQPKGTLSVSHHPAVANTPEVKVDPNEIRIDKEGNIVKPGQAAPAVPAPVAPNMPTMNAVAPAPVTPVTASTPAVPPTPPQFAPVSLPPAPAVPTPPVATPVATPAPTPTPVSTPMPPTPANRPLLTDASAPVATGPHQILNPGAQSPAITASFTADTQPGWVPTSTASSDPLMNSSEPGQILQRPGDTPVPAGTTVQSVTPPPVDSARSAVNQAIAAAPFDPSNHPLQALNATPVVDNLHPQPAVTQPQQPQPQQTPQAPPPPMPPPITATGGAVVPPPPQTQAPQPTQQR